VQVLQAAARDLQDLVAVGATVAQRLQVVLQAGHGVGHGVQLAAAGHAAAGDQFLGHVAAHAFQIVGRLAQLKDAQRAGHLLQQARDLGQAAVVPVGLDEGDEVLARGGEVGDGLVRQHLHRAPGLGHGRVFGRILGRRAQARDLLVQRGVHVEQCAGDVQQRTLGGRRLAAGDGLQRGALLQYHVAGHAQAEHAQGVGHPRQVGGLRLQGGRIAAGAQVQVQRVLDPQQLLLDRTADGVEQLAVAAGQAAPGMVQLGLAGHVRVQVEGLAQRVQCRVRHARLRHQEQQLAGRLLADHAARLGRQGVVLLGQGHGAGDAGEGAVQRRAGLQRAVAQRLGRRGQHPQHAPGGLVGGVLQHRRRALGQGRGVGGRAVLRPGGQRLLETLAGAHGLVQALGRGQRRGGRNRIGQRTGQVRGEQHALAQARLAACGADLVEQRQQHDRDVAVAVLQAFQVVRQQHGAAHQRGAGLVAVGGLAVLQRLRQQLHFLGHHGRGVQLDHAQGALHLVQVARAEAHAAGVGRVLDERLDLAARLAQGLVQLGLDPAEDGVAHGVAQRTHRRSPASWPVRMYRPMLIPPPVRPAA